jgi:ATP phosphoribosyltransferase
MSDKIENNENNGRVKVGIPKGSLEDATIELFRKAGWRINRGSRNYFPTVDDEDLSFSLVRAQEMSRFVEEGILDAGITGRDWILENDSEVAWVEELTYSKASSRPARWVLIVPRNSPYDSLEDLKGKRISTELVEFTKRYFESKGIDVKVDYSWHMVLRSFTNSCNPNRILLPTRIHTRTPSRERRSTTSLFSSRVPRKQQEWWASN